MKLSGSIIYNVKEMRSSKKYFILYNINLKDVEGIGEKSGTVYKGGGKISDKVLNTYENNHVVGSNTYKVIYKAANTSITTTQKAHYVMANDQLKVEYNEAYESCE